MKVLFRVAFIKILSGEYHDAFYFLLSAALSLTACATKTTPPLFQGNSGWKIIPNTTKLLKTDVVDGDQIAEREIEFIRTGILKSDVKNMLGVVKMKEGSPVYAASYGGAPKTFSFWHGVPLLLGTRI